MPVCSPRWRSDPNNSNSPARQYAHHIMFAHDGYKLERIPDPLPCRPVPAPVVVFGAAGSLWVLLVWVVRVYGQHRGWWGP